MVVRINIKDEDYTLLKAMAESQCRSIASILRQGFKLILKMEELKNE